MLNGTLLQNSRKKYCTEVRHAKMICDICTIPYQRTGQFMDTYFGL